MNYFQTVTDYLIVNRPRLALELEPLKQEYNSSLKSQDDVFHDEILKQYLVKLNRHICNDVTKSLALPYSEVYEILEQVDLRNFL